MNRVLLVLLILTLSSCQLSSTFTLNFQYTCKLNFNLQSCLANVVWNDDIIISLQPSDYTIRSSSLEVVAKPGKNTLKFVGAGISDNYGLSLDNV